MAAAFLAIFNITFTFIIAHTTHLLQIWTCVDGLWKFLVLLKVRPGLVLGLRSDLNQKCSLEVFPEVHPGSKLAKCPEEEEHNNKNSSNY